MKISEVIKLLQDALEKHGDVEVKYFDEDGLEEITAVDFYEGREIVLIQ